MSFMRGRPIALSRIVAIFSSCSAAVLANHSDLADFRPLDTWVSRLTGLIAQSVPFPSPLAELQSNTALAYYAHVRKPNAEFYDAVTHRALQLLEADIPVNDRVVPACLMLHSLREAGRMIFPARRKGGNSRSLIKSQS